jgi:hypothetical protein
MAVSFTIVLQLVNIVVVPLWAKAIITAAEVDPWSIAGDLLPLIPAPLVVGVILRGRYPEHRDGWKAGLEKISTVALWIAIAVGAAVNWKSIVSVLGPWVIAASVADRRLRRPRLGDRVPQPAVRDHRLEHRRHRRAVRDRRRDRALRQTFTAGARPGRANSGRTAVVVRGSVAHDVTGEQSAAAGSASVTTRSSP